jgi:ubiquinone/menaquinone biosynthesis C-methylase UbiE
MYNPGGTLAAEDFRIPLGEAEVDLVILSSIFTHLERMALCRLYLEEARRVLRPGGKVWATWFRSPPNDVCDSAVRTVFPEHEIVDAIRPFRLLSSNGGLTTDMHDQWQMLLQK